MKNKSLRLVAFTLTFIAIATMSAWAQPGGGRGGPGGQRGGGPGGQRGGPGGQRGGPGGRGFGFGGGGGGGLAQFVMRTDVQKELDLDSDQVEELREISRNAPGFRDMFQELGDSFRAMREATTDEERAVAGREIQKKTAKMFEENDEEALEVLTSSQKRRAQQLKFQYDVKDRTFAALATAGEELDEDDEEKLTEAIRDVRKELQEKIAELQMQMYAEALGKVMSASQVEKLMGDTFAFEPISPFGRGGPGGGPGGAGGNRRQRPGGGDGGDNPRRRRPGGDDDEPANPRRRRPE